jgi:propanol-preferring alcohol dehydrogenase
MKAMVLKKLGPVGPGSPPLEPAELPIPEPRTGEIRVKVSACGVCHTELDEVEGRTPPPRLPVVPGHQVVGRVDKAGPGVSAFHPGDRVGVAWIFSACGRCAFCLSGRENLCPEFKATGRDANGGYAEYMTVPADFAHPLPDGLSDIDAAPLLCAGAVGYRALRLTGVSNGGSLGLTGFGASGHLVLKMVRHTRPETRIFVFARSEKERGFARELGADWAGDTDEAAPAKLDAIIDTTPAWKPIVAALGHLAPGGRLVINAIRKEDLDKSALRELDYSAHLWMEKEVKSVANVTRRDVREFLALAAEMRIKPEVELYSLADANTPLLELKRRAIRGAKVLTIP